MPQKPEDLCPQPAAPSAGKLDPLATPLYLSSVYRCESPAQADAILGGEQAGYVYRRVAHPAADALAEKCRALHDAEAAVVTASGMAALSALLLAECRAGDHLVVSRQLYGTSRDLLVDEAARFGVGSTVVDTFDLAAVEEALTPQTKLLVVETITNPMLRVSDLAALAEIAQRRGAALAVDNTMASPLLCRPTAWGADWVLESLTKICSGHSDVVLGLLCGPRARQARVASTVARWGLASSPFDCWLAERGLATLALRFRQAAANAQRAAEFLNTQPAVARVAYPGLPNHPDHRLAQRQLSGGFGTLVTFTLAGGRAAAERFIAAVAPQIPFCPSLGELSTTLSHPETTSHRTTPAAERQMLGIDGGTIRLSVGVESPEFIIEALGAGLAQSK